jgi:hypothetical protein
MTADPSQRRLAPPSSRAKEAPSVEELAGLLAGVAEVGVRSRVGLAAQTRLLELRCVARRAQSADRGERAAALGAIVREIIAALGDAELRAVARHLFGLVGGRMTTKQARLQAAGRDVGHSWETLRKRHVPELFVEMADHLSQLERLQRAWEAMLRRAPVSSEVALDYLRRFDCYSQMAYHANACANDLQDGLTLPRPPGERESFGRDRVDLLYSALHRWAAFSHIERGYTDRFSGIWLASSWEHSDALATAAEVFDRDVPFSYRDASWLRLRLLDSRDRELDSFLEQLESSVRGRALLDSWLGWASRCRCGRRPYRSCLPHRLIAHGHHLYVVMMAEWEQVADWYREPGSHRDLSFPDQPA